jgi:hypothetical protein
MIQFVIGSSRSYITARRLAAAITHLQGDPCYYYNKNPPPHPERRHVRWGTTKRTSGNSINSRAAVRLASRKSQALIAMRNAGVPVPPIFLDDQLIQTADVRRIYRKDIRRDANDNPIFVPAGDLPNPTAVASYDYALKFIPSDREFRVHVFNGQHLALLEKKGAEGLVSSQEIRSASNGYNAIELDSEPFEGLISVCCEAVKSLGLQFGVVDILHGNDGNWYVLEVNTAPGMSDARIQLYAQKFVEWDQQHP